MVSVTWLLAGALSIASGLPQKEPATGRVKFTVLDKATGKSIPCRVHLKDAAGKPQRAARLPFWNDHFVCDGTAELELAPAKYSFEIERGPEYSSVADSFAVEAGALKEVKAELKRLIDLRAEGWWSGDLHVHRPIEDIRLLMQAEDLHVASVITWWNNRNPWTEMNLPENPLVGFDGNRYYHLMAGEDEREGGALLYFHLKRPLEIAQATREYPSPLKFAREARRDRAAWIDAEKPFWWDVPVWIAAGQIDSIGLANNHMCRDRMYESEAWGKPRIVERLPAPLGNGYWTQEIYYHLLNCGLRIPPSAGSASGVLPNPVGYNRVYVHTGPELTWEGWWDGLRKGRSFVTNGPLLRVRAGGEWPGHVFTSAEGNEVKLEIKAELTSRDRSGVLEIVKDGNVLSRTRFEELDRTGSLGAVSFKASGWFLVRTIADNPKTFRFASTAPFYVEIGESKRRISRRSARFFQDWVKERALRVKLDDAAQRKEVLLPHAEAAKFWKDVLARGTVD